MQKLSKGSIDADRRLMAKSRTCTKILAIEPEPNGHIKQFDRTSYNDRQWHSLFVYCWQHKEDFEFEYKTAAAPRALTEAQMAKMGIDTSDARPALELARLPEFAFPRAARRGWRSCSPSWPRSSSWGSGAGSCTRRRRAFYCTRCSTRSAAWPSRVPSG